MTGSSTQNNATKTAEAHAQQEIAQLFVGADDGVHQQSPQRQQENTHQEDVAGLLIGLGVEQDDEVFAADHQHGKQRKLDRRHLAAGRRGDLANLLFAIFLLQAS